MVWAHRRNRLRFFISEAKKQIRNLEALNKTLKPKESGSKVGKKSKRNGYYTPRYRERELLKRKSGTHQGFQENLKLNGPKKEVTKCGPKKEEKSYQDRMRKYWDKVIIES